MKIKKYALSILILIIFIGLTSPVINVNAQNPGEINPETGEAPPPITGVTPGLSNKPASGKTVSNTCSGVEGIGNIICKIYQILTSLVPVLVALGVLYFVWGVVSYMIGGDEEAKKKGRSKIIYSIIGLAVIVGLWGIVNVVVNTFDLGGQTVDFTDVTSPINVTAQEDQCDLSGSPKFQDLMGYATCIIANSIIPLIFSIAVMVFVWGVVQFVINSSEEAKKEKGRQFMIWGIIALTVMVSVWGLVSILGNTFGIDTTFIPQVRDQ